MRQPKSRWRTLIMVAVVACALLVFVAYRVVTKPFRKLAQEVTAIRQAGEPSEWAQCIPPPVPDRENAALIYQQAFAVLDEGSKEESAALFDFIGTKPDRARAADRQAVHRLLAKNQQALRLIRQAVNRPQCRFPVDWSDPLNVSLRHYSRLRHCARLLAADALLKREEGHPEEAVTSVRAMLQMARQIEHEPLLIGLLVRCALNTIAFNALERTLSNADVRPETYRALLAELQRHDVRKHLTRALLSERCFGRFVFSAVRSGKVSPQRLAAVASGSPGTSQGGVNLSTPMGRWILARDETTYLRLIRQSIAQSKKARYDWRALRQLDAQADNPPNLCIITAILMPFYNRLFQNPAGAQARIDACRLALALRLYRQERGSYPASLDQLQPTFLRQVPRDPFTGQAYIYKRRGQGFLVYSVGPNLKDEGGVNEFKRDGKDDISWRSER